MRTVVILKITDLALPDLLSEYNGSDRFQQAVIDAIKHDYQGLQRFGKVAVSFQDENVCISLTTNDQVNPLDIALAELKAGRLYEGVSLLKFLNACIPNNSNSDVLYLLGSALSEMGDFEHAEAYLSRALEIRPDFPEAMINLGVVFSKMQMVDRAIEILTKAIKLDPENSYAHRNLGACIVKSGQNLTMAQNHLEHAVRLAPQDQQSWLGLAGLYQIQGKTDAARKACGKVLEIEPQSPFARHARALLEQL